MRFSPPPGVCFINDPCSGNKLSKNTRNKTSQIRTKVNNYVKSSAETVSTDDIAYDNVLRKVELSQTYD